MAWYQKILHTTTTTTTTLITGELYLLHMLLSRRKKKISLGTLLATSLLISKPNRRLNHQGHTAMFFLRGTNNSRSCGYSYEVLICGYCLVIICCHWVILEATLFSFVCLVILVFFKKSQILACSFSSLKKKRELYLFSFKVKNNYISLKVHCVSDQVSFIWKIKITWFCFWLLSEELTHK